MDWLSRLVEPLQGLLDGDLSPMNRLASTRIVPAMEAMCLLVAAYFVARLVSRWTSVAICRKVDETLGKFVGRLSFYTILIAAALGILGSVGIDVAGALAVLTAAGFAIGLAFQGSLSNFAAGVLLLVFRPFKVGDMVVAGGVTGRVFEIDLFTTTFDTPDNRRLIVPNSAISSGIVENMTYHAERRVELVVGVAYGAGLEETRTALTQAALQLDALLIVGEGRGFEVLLSSLGSSSVDWTVRIWTANDKMAEARERLTREVKLQLDRAGIDIPFPQMQLHLSEETAVKRAPESVPSPALFRVKPRLRQSVDPAA